MDRILGVTTMKVIYKLEEVITKGDKTEEYSKTAGGLLIIGTPYPVSI
jgi:hypothetical protein